MASFSSKWILSHSTWYKFRRSRHEHESNGTESRMEVTSLDLGEPDQTNFEPPQEYKHIMVR